MMKPMNRHELKVAIYTLGLTQEAFGKTFDVPDRTLRRWLAGSRIPSMSAMLIRIMVARRNWNDLLTIGKGGK